MPRRMERSSSITRIMRAVMSESPGDDRSAPGPAARAGDAERYVVVTMRAFQRSYRCGLVSSWPTRRSHMRTKIAIVPLVAMLFTFLFWSAGLAGNAPRSLETLARAALRGTPEESAEAVAGLRKEGPAGMEALLALAGTCPDGSCRGAGETLDRVCGVRDCADIRLFWYTDLETAKAAARAAGKPILSLRLMGRLDEELSCANSRFFRTVYYQDHEINQLLRERFVLHWRSVRPVPRVTIDFGDGTRLERTLTGNSIHYILDSRGRLIEALPGLSGPAAFRSALETAEQAARTAAGLEDAELVDWLTAHHRFQLEARSSAWSRDLAAL